MNNTNLDLNIATVAGAMSMARLLPLFERESAAGNALVMATVTRTQGPTYTKPGAQLLIAANGEYAGLLSGGCLEGDLSEHAREISLGGKTRTLHYDARGPDDLLFGLGSGCEGAMDILLQRLLPGDAWQPLGRLSLAWRERRPERYALVTRSSLAALPPGTTIFGDGAIYGTPPHCAPVHSSTFQGLPQGALTARIVAILNARPDTGVYAPTPPPQAAGEASREAVDVLLINQIRPARLLLLGAGPDAQPVAQLAHFLGWVVTVFDHRAAYARAARFPTAATVIHAPRDELVDRVALDEHSAAVVMSHHYLTDLAYLRTLARTILPYVGLLGPAVRRDRLLAALGDEAQVLGARLHAPVGFDIGANSPEAIALAIVAEIHAALGAAQGKT